MIGFDGRATSPGVDGTARPSTRTADGDWNGQLYSAAAGLSYEMRARPAVACVRPRRSTITG